MWHPCFFQKKCILWQCKNLIYSKGVVYKLHAGWLINRTPGEFINRCFLLNLKDFSVEILQKEGRASDTKLVLTNNYSEITFLENLWISRAMFPKMSFSPGHFESTCQRVQNCLFFWNVVFWKSTSQSKNYRTEKWFSFFIIWFYVMRYMTG